MEIWEEIAGSWRRASDGLEEVEMDDGMVVMIGVRASMADLNFECDLGDVSFGDIGLVLVVVVVVWVASVVVLVNSGVDGAASEEEEELPESDIYRV